MGTLEKGLRQLCRKLHLQNCARNRCGEDRGRPNGVEGGNLKADHGKGGSMWQGKCATLTPPMLGHEIEKKLVAENQAATLPAVTLNGGTGGLGVYVDDDGAEDVD
ncbi:hypothetical protein AHAS_Ahas05G0216700 [Arachis hypogaea]